MNASDFRRKKADGEKISITTCYDYWSARILRETSIDAILVGDSAAMVMHGQPSTLPATTDLMVLHTEAVARGAPEKFLIADIPFLSFHKGLKPAMDTVEALIHAGANAVKMEGIDGIEGVVERVVLAGVPVMGHLGLTPQAVNRIGGFKVQGGSKESAAQLADQAKRVADAGCFSIVLECIPVDTARQITADVAVPTIGIGAGPHCDGQVLVLHDLAGFNRDFHAKFVKAFEDGFDLVQRAVNAFDRETKEGSFPTDAQSYS